MESPPVSACLEHRGRMGSSLGALLLWNGLCPGLLTRDPHHRPPAGTSRLRATPRREAQIRNPPPPSHPFLKSSPLAACSTSLTSPCSLVVVNAGSTAVDTGTKGKPQAKRDAQARGELLSLRVSRVPFLRGQLVKGWCPDPGLLTPDPAACTVPLLASLFRTSVPRVEVQLLHPSCPKPGPPPVSPSLGGSHLHLATQLETWDSAGHHGARL